ncbi:MAG: dihydropteroate synthase [Chromatiales bacterium]|jgi:dihydropteroate synthase|nr:dihydropteroate synthase [Chromatiales bacterium]
MSTNAAAVLDCGAGCFLSLDRPRIMGILNVNPDSFTDGGDFFSTAAALERASAMVSEGADIIDVGGESSRPGAEPVSIADELARVIPVIEGIRRTFPGVIISIDTCKPEVMRAAVAAGAQIVNDITALRAEGALETVAELGCAVCLMHMQGEPRTMQHAPHYDEVVAEVLAFLEARVDACVKVGIPRQRLLLDPGIGFGKSLEHNLTLLGRLDALHAPGLPLLLGASRKSMIGALTGRPADERLYASIALATLGVWQGAAVVRVHDVRGTVDALRVCAAVNKARGTSNT